MLKRKGDGMDLVFSLFLRMRILYQWIFAEWRIWHYRRIGLCGAEKDRFVCNLLKGHLYAHRDCNPSGGCVGWGNNSEEKENLMSNPQKNLPRIT